MTDSIGIIYPYENGIDLCLLWFLSQAEVGSHVTISSKSRSSTGLQLVLKQSVSSHERSWSNHLEVC